MRNKDFVSPDHADSYLRHCIIRLNEEPIYVLGVTSLSGEGLLYSFPHRMDVNDDMKKINLKDEDIDMTPVPLGFVNFSTFISKAYAYSVTRLPVRAWKVGLTTNNMTVLNRDIEHKQLMFSEGFRRTVIGAFPSLDECIKKHKEVNSIAFSRHFSVDCFGNLFHHLIEEPVGSVYNNKELKLKERYTFLTEALAEDIK